MQCVRKVKTVNGLDLVRYSGLWYEIGRTPFEYERFEAAGAQFECASATAQYTLVPLSENYDLEGGRLGLKIVNRCFSGSGVEIATATGLAVPLPFSDPATSCAIFRVGFDSFEILGPGGKKIPLPTDTDMGKMSSGYWVHWIAPDYSLVVVGSPALDISTEESSQLLGKVWVLSRSPTISAKEMMLVRAEIADIGYNETRVQENPGTVI